MDYLNAIILGLVQGLTEFLPISSSAHLRIVGEFLSGGGDPGAAFTAIIQLGTELAVLIYFRRDIARIVSKWVRALFSRGGRRSSGVQRGDPDVRLGWLIIIATVPIVVVGVLAQDAIRSGLRNLWITAVVLIVFGILLGVVDVVASRAKRITDVGYRDGVLIGIAQVLALIPGVSRSGATTTAARALGYERPAAARFSFLLAIPAVFGSGLYELYGALKDSVPQPYGWGETAVAGVVAFAVGLAVIAFLMRYIEHRSFLPFVIYRILLGIALIVLLLTGVLAPL